MTVFLRTATKDTELRDIPIKVGERAAIFYPSANRDESRFADPDRAMSGGAALTGAAADSHNLGNKPHLLADLQKPADRRGVALNL